MGKKCRQQFIQQQAFYAPVMQAKHKYHKSQPCAPVQTQAPSCAAPKDSFTPNTTNDSNSIVSPAPWTTFDTKELSPKEFDSSLDKENYQGLKFYRARTNGESYLVLRDTRAGVDPSVKMIKESKANEIRKNGGSIFDPAHSKTLGWTVVPASLKQSIDYMNAPSGTEEKGIESKPEMPVTEKPVTPIEDAKVESEPVITELTKSKPENFGSKPEEVNSFLYQAKIDNEWYLIDHYSKKDGSDGFSYVPYKSALDWLGREENKGKNLFATEAKVWFNDTVPEKPEASEKLKTMIRDSEKKAAEAMPSPPESAPKVEKEFIPSFKRDKYNGYNLRTPGALWCMNLNGSNIKEKSNFNKETNSLDLVHPHTLISDNGELDDIKALALKISYKDPGTIAIRASYDTDEDSALKSAELAEEFVIDSSSKDIIFADKNITEIARNFLEEMKSSSDETVKEGINHILKQYENNSPIEAMVADENEIPTTVTFAPESENKTAPIVVKPMKNPEAEVGPPPPELPINIVEERPEPPALPVTIADEPIDIPNLGPLVISGTKGLADGLMMLPVGIKALSDLNEDLKTQLKNEINETAKSMLLQGLDFATEAVEFGKAVKTNVSGFMKGANKIAPPIATALNLEGQIFKSNTLAERTPRKPLVRDITDIKRTTSEVETTPSRPTNTTYDFKGKDFYMDKSTVAKNPSETKENNRGAAATPESIVDLTPIRISLNKDLSQSNKTFEPIVIEEMKESPEQEKETKEQPAKETEPAPIRIKLGKVDLKQLGSKLELAIPEVKKSPKQETTKPIKTSTPPVSKETKTIDEALKLSELKLSNEAKEKLFGKHELANSKVDRIKTDDGSIELLYHNSTSAVALRIYAKNKDEIVVQTAQANNKNEAINGLDKAKELAVLQNQSVGVKLGEGYPYLNYLTKKSEQKNNNQYYPIFIEIQSLLKTIGRELFKKVDGDYTIIKTPTNVK